MAAHWWEQYLESYKPQQEQAGGGVGVSVPSVPVIHPYALEAQRRAKQFAGTPTKQQQTPVASTVTASDAAGAGGGSALDYAGGYQRDILEAQWAEAAARMQQEADLAREQMALQKAIAEMELAYKYKLMESQNEQAAKQFALQVGQLELNRQLSTGWVQKRPITVNNMPSLSTQAYASTPGGEFKPSANWGQMMGRYAKPAWWKGG